MPRILPIALSLLIATAGCANTQTDFVGRAPPEQLRPIQPVNREGVYVAMWTPSDKEHLLPLAGDTYYAKPGDTLGFARDKQGRLVSVHNGATQPVGPPPSTAKYVVWRHVERRETAFGQQMQAIGEESNVAMEAFFAGVVIGSFYTLVFVISDCRLSHSPRS